MSVFGKKYHWSHENDAELYALMEDGGNWEQAARLLNRSTYSCELRYNKLKAEKQAVSETPIIRDSVNYLRSRGFITFQDGDTYMVGNTSMTVKQLISKAKRVKQNTEMLAGAQ